MKDNNSFLDLNPFHFVINDLKSTAILHQGTSSDGLYPFRLPIKKPGNGSIKSACVFHTTQSFGDLWHHWYGELGKKMGALQLPPKSPAFYQSCQLAKNRILPFLHWLQNLLKFYSWMYEDLPLLSNGEFCSYLFMVNFSGYSWFVPYTRSLKSFIILCNSKPWLRICSFQK